jgi:hypothetical protein
MLFISFIYNLADSAKENEECTKSNTDKIKSQS